jgi:hypothetical protein
VSAGMRTEIVDRARSVELVRVELIRACRHAHLNSSNTDHRPMIQHRIWHSMMDHP